MTDEVGDPVTLTGAFTVAAVPDANWLTLTLQPGDGDVVGVGAPIVVRFDQRSPIGPLWKGDVRRRLADRRQLALGELHGGALPPTEPWPPGHGSG